MKPDRLDHVLVARGLAENRTRAQALILAGRVRSGDRRLDKPGTRIPPDLPLEVAAGPLWVGRGGHKLAGALERFGIDVRDRVALDVGASTGGFTDVLLDHGARRVAAVDVGRGQLDWKLRNDERVDVLEGINARHMTPADLPFQPQLGVVDVSFISLTLILPAMAACLVDDSPLVALVKPQFEVGRGRVGRGGIVRDPADHRAVLEKLVSFAPTCGIDVRDVARSVIRGAEGNVEFFLHGVIVPQDPGTRDLAARIEAALVEEVPS